MPSPPSKRTLQVLAVFVVALSLQGLSFVAFYQATPERTVRRAGSFPTPPVTYTVDVLSDGSDANPGDGTCDDGSGNCPFRAAAEEANAWGGSGAPLINFGTSGTITATRPVTLTNRVNIKAPLPINVTIDGSSSSDGSGLFFDSGADGSTLQGLQVQNFSSGTFGSGNSCLRIGANNVVMTDVIGTSCGGYGVYIDPGSSESRFTAVTLTNSAGGASINGPNTTINDGLLGNNTFYGSDIGFDALTPPTNTVFSNTTVTNNGVYGLYPLNGTADLTVSGSTISGNGTSGSGFGIFNDSGSDIEIRNSTIKNNTSGGLYVTGGASNTNIISNTIGPGPDPAVTVDGSSTTDIKIQSNTFEHYTSTAPLDLVGGANEGIAPPTVQNADIVDPNTITIRVSSSNDPASFTYPLTGEVYRVRSNDWTPLGTFEYTESDHPTTKVFSVTTSVPVVSSDRVESTWTTANPKTSEFSDDGRLLPVELTAFDATLDDEAVVLRWSTASETNNAGFDVQRLRVRDGEVGHRGTDGVAPQGAASEAWETLAFVEGHGTTTEPQAYTYRVEELDPGAHTFRLKQVDFDGGFEYSPEVEVFVELPEAYRLSAAYPNPFNPTTTFTLTVAREQHVAIEVFDLQGRRVATMHDGPLSANQAHAFTIDGAGWPSGLYLYRATGETFEATRRVTLLK